MTGIQKGKTHNYAHINTLRFWAALLKSKKKVGD